MPTKREDDVRAEDASTPKHDTMTPPKVLPGIATAELFLESCWDNPVVLSRLGNTEHGQYSIRQCEALLNALAVAAKGRHKEIAETLDMEQNDFSKRIRKRLSEPLSAFAMFAMCHAAGVDVVSVLRAVSDDSGGTP